MVVTGRPAIALLIGALGTLGALAAPGCDRAREATAATDRAGARPAASVPRDPAPPPAPAPPSIDPSKVVAAVAGEPIERTLLLDSHLMVERNVGVTTRRDGIIEEIKAERGDRVKENQPLATLECGDLVVSQNAAQLDLDKENSSFERARKLREQKIIPEEEFEQSRLRRETAEKSLERIVYELTKCTLKAPFDGVVSGRYVEKGQVVKFDDRLTLYQVTALEPLLARIYVPEWATFGLKRGEPARVIPQEGPHADGQEAGRGGIAARIRWINDVVDAASATSEVLVEVLPGPAASDLRPGMSVRVALDLELAGDGAVSRPSRGAPPDAAAVVSLPREAVGAWPGSDPAPGQEVSLRILAQDGTIETRPVVLGFIGDRRVQVRRGLRPGEKVVLPQ